MIRLRSLLLALVLTALAVAGPGGHAAPAPSQVFVSAYQYFPGDEDYTVSSGDELITSLVVPQGGDINFSNFDVNFQSHSFTADEVGANGVPIFDTGLVLINRSMMVAGISQLPPRVYGFHCRQHDWVMHGYLQIV